MKNFECDRCGKCFNYKHHLEGHLNKKNQCDKLVNKEEKEERESIEPEIKEKLIIPNNNENIKIIDAKSLREFLEKCNCVYCGKHFSYKHSVLYHIKNNCKRVKEIEEEKHKIFEGLKKIEEEKEKLKEENQKLKSENQKFKDKMEKKLKELEKDLAKNIKKSNELNKTISNTTNIDNTNNSVRIENNNIDNSVNNNTDNSVKIDNRTNNNQQNLYLANYNKEDLSKIDKSEILAIMKRGFQSTVELTRAIHFNPKYPEYHNIYIARINERYAMVYTNHKWRIMDKNELVNDIYDNKRDFIIQNLENFITQLDENKKKSLKRWLDRDDNDISIKNTKNDIKMLLFNNRHMVMDKKKEIESIERKKKLDIIKKSDILVKKSDAHIKKSNALLKKYIKNKGDSDSDSDRISNYSYESKKSNSSKKEQK
jgi:hypothetical protein